MKKRNLSQCVILSALILAAGARAQSNTPLPRLEKRGALTQLIVDGKPFIILGGQVNNPTGFPDRMEAAWPKLELVTWVGV